MLENTPPLAPEEALPLLAERIAAALEEFPDRMHPRRFARVEVRISGDVRPLDWLRAQRGCTQYYWAERDGSFEMAGIGEADVLAPMEGARIAALFEHVQSQLSPELYGLRYYGGFRFHSGPVKGERWKAFKEYRFVAPRIEVVRRNDAVYLACNARLAHPRTNAQTLQRLREAIAGVAFPPSPVPSDLPRLGEREDHPNREEWIQLVRKAVNTIARAELDKVVLARETCYRADAPIDAVSLLTCLSDTAMRCFVFCFHPAPDRAFIGASPELLYRRASVHVRSEAIAGTRARGKSDGEDRALGEALLGCDKERREQAFVARMLRERFDALCRYVEMEPGPSLLQLRALQHLRTRIEGLLEDPDCDPALIETLHPTPAVGGVPRADALEWIAAEEPFDRGIYAGPVGWIGSDAAEFCVGIRSGLVQGDTLAVYNGAGIVAGSIPEQEWEELETKMRSFMCVLGAMPD